MAAGEPELSPVKTFQTQLRGRAGILKRLGSVLVRITLCLLCAGLATARAQTTNEEIGAVIKAYEKALNTSDTSAVMTLYGSDPVFMPQNSKALVGREAVQACYERVFSTVKMKIVFTIHEIVELGDAAYARTSSAGQMDILAANAKVNDAFNEMFVFRKEKGQWRIHRYIFSNANPAPPSK